MGSHPLLVALVARLCDRHPARADVSTKTVLSLGRHQFCEVMIRRPLWSTRTRRVVSPGVWAAAVLRRWGVDLWQHREPVNSPRYPQSNMRGSERFAAWRLRGPIEPVSPAQDQDKNRVGLGFVARKAFMTPSLRTVIRRR